MIEIIERHMVGGERHEHIAEVKYVNKDGNVREVSRETIVAWLDESKDNQAIVRAREDHTKYVYVGTVHPDHAPAFIRTYANGKWTDNLLSLPEY